MNVIFYVMDCLRADHVHALGYSRETTPVLDRLAREGVAFRNCYAQSGWTAPSAATMFSGQHPSRTGIHKMRDALNADLPWLPTALKDNGFSTVGFSSMYQVSKLRGFDRGFTDFFDLFLDEEMKQRCAARDQDARGAHYCLPLSEDLHYRAIKWLDARGDSYDPFFWLVWSIDTHEPFRHPEKHNTDADPAYRGGVTGRGRPFAQVKNERDKQHLIDIYDGALRYQDEKLGELVAELEKRDLLDDTLLVVVGDHGEMFWEHGLAGHGKFPWQEELRVPLIMRCPQALPQGKVYGAMVQMIDVAPTILDICGLPAEPRFKGKSLRPLFDGASDLHEAIVLEVPFPFDRAERARVVIDKDGFKFVEYTPPGFGRRVKKLLKEYGRLWLSLLRPGTIPLLYGHHFRKGISGLLKAACIDPWIMLLGIPTRRLFDLKTDPTERRGAYNAAKQAELRGYLDALDRGEAVGAKSLAGASAAEQEKKIEEHLKQLGYVEE
ncbi:MAG: sulfatase [Planctomycetes bacterium]|nr:sulfatase [Planctomycetota bacterium]